MLTISCSAQAAEPWTPLPAHTATAMEPPPTSEPVTPLPAPTAEPDLPWMYVLAGNSRVLGNRRVEARYFGVKEDGTYTHAQIGSLAPWDGFDTARPVPVLSGDMLTFVLSDGYSTSTITGGIYIAMKRTPWLETGTMMKEIVSGEPLMVDLFPSSCALILKGTWPNGRVYYDFRLDVIPHPTPTPHPRPSPRTAPLGY
ncbi:MAG: hypothetical protein FJ319_05845 [SAR202 cluster bacterium]|nr:hypothetical protein [SAR202 cluster bacterium]